jgi:hypothetical protein
MIPGLFVALALVGQPMAAKPQTIDPLITPEIRPALMEAALAERDPRRGTGNAMNVLKAAKSKLPTPVAQLPIDLRMAALVVRQRALSDTKFTEPVRWETAISTFSRLELTEPLLDVWLEDAIAHHPDAKKKIGKKSDRVIKAALLLRGDGLEKKATQDTFAAPIVALGYKIEWVSAKEASYIVKLAAEDTRSTTAGKRAVRVIMGLESIHEGKLEWSEELFRTEEAPDPAIAQASAMDWIARVGGRDLFFRWLGENVYPAILTGLGPGATPPAGQGHDGHGH